METGVPYLLTKSFTRASATVSAVSSGKALALTHTLHWASQLLTSARMSCQYFSCRFHSQMSCPSLPVGLLEDLFPLASRNQHSGVNFHFIRTLPLPVDDAISQHQALPFPPVGFGGQTELGYFIPPGFFFSFRQPSPDRHDVGVFFLQFLPLSIRPQRLYSDRRHPVVFLQTKAGGVFFHLFRGFTFCTLYLRVATVGAPPSFRLIAATLWFSSRRRQVVSSSTSSGDSLSVLCISGSPLSELLPLSGCSFGRLLKPSALL